MKTFHIINNQNTKNIIISENAELSDLWRQKKLNPESIKDNDFEAKLVLCLRNKITKDEQIFSLNLDRNISAGFIKFHEQSRDLFTRDGLSISTLRRIETNSYRDILGSYNSRRMDSARKGESGQTTQTAERQSTANGADAQYSVISFAELYESPLMNIQKKAGEKIMDDQDIDIRVTNLESMRNFFVKVRANSICQKAESTSIQIKQEAQMELNYINHRASQDYVLRVMRESAKGSKRKTVVRHVGSVSVTWTEKENSEESTNFYDSKFIILCHIMCIKLCI